MKTSQLHSEKIKKYLTVNHLQLLKRSAGFSGDEVDRLKAFRVNVTNPLPDLNAALDVMEPLHAYMAVLENYRDLNTSEGFAAFLNTMYGEFLGCYLDCMEWIMTSVKPEERDMDGDLFRFRVEQKIKSFRKRENKPLDVDGFEKLAGEALLKDDPAYTYCKSKKTIPYRIHRFIIEQKLPGTQAMIAVCQDYAGKWRNIQAKMDHARSKDIVDDFTWNSLFKDEDRLISDWKDTMLILAGKKHGQQSAVSGLGDVSKRAES